MWTMGWFVYYLNSSRKATAYSIVVILVFILEMFVITWQAANGRKSHFNNETPLSGLLFGMMGLAIFSCGFGQPLSPFFSLQKNN
jgi:hypothetical protein